MKKLTITPEEIAIITNRSASYARTIIQKIKTLLNKEKHQLVTIREFVDYMGFEFDEVDAMVNSKGSTGLKRYV
ncbi:hypothetical protein ES677_12095 [Bizionia gelidisalsuginis]|uniref:Uncharacterized protein n=2 Tax=Bizionia TaxID=283785 RepID=A0A8H2LCE9_9FLAO|nr:MULTISPECIES: hypothetical protein [Bizionia]TYB70651.1 hypothetical protein ES676_12800 [Bizionia saleffrena]TYC10221.1 hypothetical protein ES677_12095 [Bizionia gelidisalsuginis]